MKTKKFLIIAAIASVALAGCSKDKHVEPDGSPDNPFIVNKAATLKKVGTGTNGWGLDKHYRQTANISLSGVWTPIGTFDAQFTGSYDGGGFSINYLTIPATIDPYQGLFGFIGTRGEVRNVALRNVNINTESIDVGGIAGWNNGTIENCYVTGTVNGRGLVGGVVGLNNKGEIKNCYTTCNVTGEARVGGIAGYSNEIKVENCYATGIITGENYVGGIVGFNDNASATVQYCVALNKEVSATNVTDNVGRVVGINNGLPSSILTNNFARASGMTLKRNGGNVTLAAGDKGANTKHGADVGALYTHGAESVSFWETVCDTQLWDLDANRLPHLKTTEGGEFSEAQNPIVL